MHKKRQLVGVDNNVNAESLIQMQCQKTAEHQMHTERQTCEKYSVLEHKTTQNLA